MAGEEMAVGVLKNAFFYTLLLSDEALYILDDSARVYLLGALRPRASKAYAYLLCMYIHVLVQNKGQHLMVSIISPCSRNRDTQN